MFGKKNFQHGFVRGTVMTITVSTSFPFSVVHKQCGQQGKSGSF